MKDFIDGLNQLFDDIYTGATGRRGDRPDSGDPELDRAWQDLDAFMKEGSRPGAFGEMDRGFADFDRKFAAGGKAPSFEELKAQARAAGTGSAQGAQSGGPGARQHGQGSAQGQSQGRSQAEDPLLTRARELVRDYHNLELKPGASAEEVKAAYKRLIKQYHPDRFANDPAKQATATQISAKLNQSYNSLMEHLA